MHEAILSGLANFENRAKVKILFAAEAGSRAWGFASPDSDYDMRFVYHHPLPWYLGLEKKSDTLEAMAAGDLDFSGWDLRKTLLLFAGCSPALNEWLDSPFLYLDQGLRKPLADLVGSYFNPRRALHHYLRMAENTLADHLNGDTIKIKKLFYILRPLLACAFIETRLTMPPTPFQALFEADLLPSAPAAITREVLARKAGAREGDLVSLPVDLRDWIQGALARGRSLLEGEKLPVSTSPGFTPLEEILLGCLGF